MWRDFFTSKSKLFVHITNLNSRISDLQQELLIANSYKNESKMCMEETRRANQERDIYKMFHANDTLLFVEYGNRIQRLEWLLKQTEDRVAELIARG
jgi:hypothetical protein